ncbi:MAG: DUF2071 domain-containing protein [Planctomycetales bacterium]|nr:DUF2071 domain-containing protein [Planctomycetales bacterium]
MAVEKVFLTTEWTHLAMLNFVVEPKILLPHVPAGTKLDTFEGLTFVSMVGFQYQRTRVLGLPVPFHRNFVEVNLRFYVRRLADEGWRRGVVFLKEIVALPAVAWVARRFYDENFCVHPMRYAIDTSDGNPSAVCGACYEWKFQGQWQQLDVQSVGQPHDTTPGSEANFIVEHYWGYTRRRDGSTSEYRVEHPPWRVWTVSASQFQCDVARLYGPEFAQPLSVAPHSALLAEGSKVVVRSGRKLVV